MLIEPAATPTPTHQEIATKPTVPTSPPRFNLRRALAKCEPHSTARIELKINLGERVQIDDRPTGELGRCVEDMLTAHPPKRSETIEL